MGAAKIGIIAGLALITAPLMIFVLIIGIAAVGAADKPPPAGGSGGSGVLLPGSVPEKYRTFITQAGSHCAEITAPLIAAQLNQESGFNPKAVSPVGAEGIAQFTPDTWVVWGKDYSEDNIADIWNAQDAIGSQADYMCGLVSMIKSWINKGQVTGDVVRLALAAYNAGPGAVHQAGGMPGIQETVAYVKNILDSIKKYAAPGGQVGDRQIETVIAAAEAENHDRYIFGADGPDAWDCSSLVQHAWRAVGVDLPRTTYQQVKSPLLEQVPWKDRRRGDLIYFHIDGAALPDHVGLALSDHLMIHASHPHPNPEDDIVEADYTVQYYLDAKPMVMRVITS